MKITIVTAVLAEKDDHLGALWESLETQELPPGWEWQWVLQEDGETGRPSKRIPSDPRISAGMAPWGGESRARTLALSRVEGALVRAVDADDMLPAGALAQDVETLTSHPEVGWCVSPAIDLFVDGTRQRGPRDPDPGPLRRGCLEEGERAGLLQVLGGTMTAYTELVQLLGGWPPLAAEDVGLLLAAEAVSPGWMQAEPGLIYRRWDKAECWGRDKSQASAATVGRGVMLERVAALRRTGWSWTPARLAAGAVWSGCASS
jgi:glycosyltransferase involved in cell wall biosynthesis